jgi:hypothetical protein
MEMRLERVCQPHRLLKAESSAGQTRILSWATVFPASELVGASRREPVAEGAFGVLVAAFLRAAFRCPRSVTTERSDRGPADVLQAVKLYIGNGTGP